MDWLESCLGMTSVRSTGSWRWRAPARGLHEASAIAEAPASYNPASAAIGRGMTFEVVNDPAALEEALRVCMREGHTARLVAPYGRPWKTKKKRDPHALPPGERDFDIRFERGEELTAGANLELRTRRRLHPVRASAAWHQNAQRSPLRSWVPVRSAWLRLRLPRRPLAQGSHISGRALTFDLSHIHETGLVQSKAAAKREHSDGPASRELLRRLQQVYRILFSRALRGIYVWFEDEETRKHVSSLLPT